MEDVFLIIHENLRAVVPQEALPLGKTWPTLGPFFSIRKNRRKALGAAKASFHFSWLDKIVFVRS